MQISLLKNKVLLEQAMLIHLHSVHTGDFILQETSLVEAESEQQSLKCLLNGLFQKHC